MEEVVGEIRLALESSKIERYENTVYQIKSSNLGEKERLKSLLVQGDCSEHSTVVEVDFVKEHHKVSRKLKRVRQIYGEAPVECFSFREDGPDIRIFNSPLLLYGEYVKLSRSMCQSPLKIAGELKTARCVSDFCFEFQKFFGSGPVKFMASGREDIDVRCLEGRPFIVEVSYPTRNLNASAVDLGLYEDVDIKNLSLVSKACKDAVNCGTPNKFYNLLIFSRHKLGFEASYELSQRTPLRVLHRRADILRNKTIDVLKVEELEDDSGYYYDVDIKASSGTYIKEWVNGDFDRTIPNLDADILELDVIRVEASIDPACILRRISVTKHTLECGTVATSLHSQKDFSD